MLINRKRKKTARMKPKTKILTFMNCRHRVITVIEVQRLVVLGSTALFTMVWQLRIHTHRDEGWDNFLFVETE